MPHLPGQTADDILANDLSAAAQLEHPEGFWARVWELFLENQTSAESERAYIHARRVRDEFWYAARFGLDWPKLVLGPKAKPSIFDLDQPLLFGSPSPCNYHIIGPADVPGLSRYKYKLDLPKGTTATDIQWTRDKATATILPPSNKVEVEVEFANTTADWIKLRADFKVNGHPECAEKEIFLVKVEIKVSTATLENRGIPAGKNDPHTRVFLVTLPPPPDPPNWVLKATPPKTGEDCAVFTYNGGLQNPEPSKLVEAAPEISSTYAAFHAKVDVVLTAPEKKPDALQQIELGFIQNGAASGTATYSTNPAGLKRTLTTPTNNSLDWLDLPCTPAPGNKWPWIDPEGNKTGAGTGTWSDFIDMFDRPSITIPAKYNPNNTSDPNTAADLATAAPSYHFKAIAAAHTKDTDLGADKRYFDYAHVNWSVDFRWPVPTPPTSFVTIKAPMQLSTAVTEIDVNVVPTITNCTYAPYARYIPDTP